MDRFADFTDESLSPNGATMIPCNQFVAQVAAIREALSEEMDEGKAEEVREEGV